MNISKKIILFTTLLIFLVSISAVSAVTDNNDTQISNDSQLIQSNPTTITSNSTQTVISNDKNLVKEDNSNNKNTNIEKAIQKQSQQSDTHSITTKNTVTKKITKIVNKENNTTSNIKLANDDSNTIYINASYTGDISTGTKEYPYTNINNGFDQVSNTKNNVFIATGYYKVSNKIYIGNNINIIGETKNGTIISGNYKYRILETAPGTTVSITNITFINSGKTNVTGFEDRAIYNNGNLIISNSNFINNTANESGGAIYNYIGNVIVSDSNFINNHAVNSSGAIYNTGNLTVINSNFINNTAQYAGALYNNGNISYYYNNSKMNIINSSFIGNSVNSYGGVIYNYWGIINIDKSIFTNSKTMINSGVIYNSGDLFITNSIFSNNYSPYGGVIYDYGNDTIYNSYVEIKNCDFINNNAKEFGGALYNFRSVIKLSDSYFYKNTAGNNSGAIENSGNLTVTNTIFANNSAYHGGAVYNYLNSSYPYYTVDMSIINCSFINNSAVSYGGAIENDWANLTVTSSTFLNNIAKSQKGNSIHNLNISSLKANYNVFINNKYSGSEIYTNLDHASILLNYNWFGQDTSNYKVSPYKLGLINYQGNNMTTWLYENMTIGGNQTINTPTNVTVTLNGFYNSKTQTTSRIRASLLSQNIPITFVTVNGTANPSSTNMTKGNLTVQYTPTSQTSSITTTNSNNKTIITAKSINSKITINQVNGTINNIVTLQANIKDILANNLTGGIVIFKVNGITLKYTNGSAISVPVVNGIAKLNYIAQKSWSNKDSKIEVIYSGVTDKYNPTSTISTLNISKRTAVLNLTFNKNITKAQDTVQFTTIIKDGNGTLVNNGLVVFKLNGKTIRDSNGNTVIVNVTKGQALYNYTVPNGISQHTYTITAVYSNNIYNRVTTNTPLTTEKTNMNLVLNQLTTIRGSNSTQLTGKIIDTNGNPTVGTVKVAIKLNGKQLQNAKVINGTINLNITIPSTLKGTNYTINVISGTNNAYIGTKLNTTLIIKPKVNS